MSSKLTLTMEQETINKAKRYAKKQGRSLFIITRNLNDFKHSHIKTFTPEAFLKSISEA